MRVSNGAASLCAAVALVFAGCDSGSSPTAASPEVPGVELARGNDGRIGGEELEVCKSGSAGDFTLSVDDPSAPGLTLHFGTSFSLADGECKLLADKSFGDIEITVTETAAEAGFQFDHVDVTTSSGRDLSDPDGVASTTGPITSTDPSVTVTISGAQGGFEGALLEYVNVPVATNGGGEGCTPGYWKQDQHFDSYPTGVDPEDGIEAHLGELAGDVQLRKPENGSIEDLSLLEALRLRGGGVNALLRHAVAAWLNAGTVAYPLTQSEVVDALNAALTSGDYEAAKDEFAADNEEGCPLN